MAKTFRLDQPKQRADLYLQLAALERAGIAPAQAVAMLDPPKTEDSDQLLQLLRSRLERGADWVETGRRYGLFTKFDAALLGAAAATGSLASAYRQLSDHYDAQARRRGQIRARLALPVAVLVLAGLIQPLPELVLGRVDGLGYLKLALLPLLQMGLGAYALFKFPTWFRGGALSPFRAGFDRLLLRLPKLGRYEMRRNLRDFWSSLALLLEAGVPMLDAFPKALGTVDNLVLRAQLAPAERTLKRGGDLASALRTLPWPGPPEALSFVATGEASGELPALLRRYAGQEAERVARFDDALAEWLPRLVYGAVLAMMAASILGSGAFMPSAALSAL